MVSSTPFNDAQEKGEMASFLCRPKGLGAALLLMGSALASAQSGGMNVDDPRLARTVTERPFEVIIDRRACGTRGVYVQVLGAGADDPRGRPSGLGLPGLGRWEGSGAHRHGPWLGAPLRSPAPTSRTSSPWSLASFTSDTAPIYRPSYMALQVLRRKEDLRSSAPATEKPSDSKPGLVGSSGPTVPTPTSPISSHPSPKAASRCSRRKSTARGRPWRGFRRDGIALSAIATDHGGARASPGAWTWAESGITFTGDTETGAKR